LIGIAEAACTIECDGTPAAEITFGAGLVLVSLISLCVFSHLSFTFFLSTCA
jgi:hypothetical protein